ncbi:hypothetical protein Tco_0940508 [Tanacetum coccineum]|uniref:Uncharacterized protein n=1 Tax=Tanacetum coccineum TaxID=301880 RepID=A0ABQ5DP36_9ASTR
MGDKNSNRPRTLGDYSRPSHEGYRNAIELPEGAKVSPAIRHHPVGAKRMCIPQTYEEAWETIKDLAQHEEEEEWNDLIFSKKGSPDYIDATLEQELESMECRVGFFMRNEVLLEYEVGFTFPKRSYQEKLEARILNLIDHQEDQVRQLEEDMRKIKDTFMCLADSLIATLKVIIEAQRV